MRGALVYTFAVLCLVSDSIGKKGFGPGEQEWGYVTVHDKAHMFWWLYYTTANVTSYYDKPLIIWLQGGPGGSSTSYGNFEELGPLDVNQNPRSYTWVKDYNVLFIDNPVGTGFSYVETASSFVLTNEQIANDLVTCMQGFYEALPKFRDVPTYITTESYGGKMGAEFALRWYQAQKLGDIESNLKGVALGDSWISPIDSVLTWAPFLLATGMVDTEGFQKIDEAAETANDLIEKGEWTAATNAWSYTQSVVFEQTYNIDFYNILTKSSANLVSEQNVSTSRVSYPYLKQADSIPLQKLMNGPVREALGIGAEVVHGRQSSDVFKNLREDFMKPVIDIVEKILNETDLNCFVYNGQLDLIVDTPGTLLWVEKLKWKKANAWKNAIRNPLVVDGIIEGYFKVQDNFGMYWVNRAGHMVPRDNPVTQEVILRHLTSNAKN